MKTNGNHLAAHPNVDAMAAGAHDAVDWAADAASNASDRVADVGHQAMAKQEEWLTKARAYVEDNPTTSIAIALASGFLLSFILRARK